MDRRARRQADGLADLPHARRVAAAADLAVDELEDLTLSGGQIGHEGRRKHDRAFVANTCSIFPLTPNTRSAWMLEQAFGRTTGPSSRPDVAVTPPWFAGSTGRKPDRRAKEQDQMATVTTAFGIGTAALPATRRTPRRRCHRRGLPGVRPCPTGVGASPWCSRWARGRDGAGGRALGGSPLAAPERTRPPLSARHVVVVEPGDTLWSIAVRSRRARIRARSSTP